MRYYQLLCLQRERDVSIDGLTLRVSLPPESERHIIENDVQLLNHVAPQHVFFFSGGGSILINGRYLLAVRREASARINPGQLSLFTGRSDGPHEWRAPEKIVREFFEELLLYRDGRPAIPECPEFQSEINQVYSKFKDISYSTFRASLTVLKPARPYYVELYENQKLSAKTHCYWTINPRGEINLFYLFDAQLDIQSFSAQDGELRRDIVVLDCATERQGEMLNHQWPSEWSSWNRSLFSTNLSWLLEQMNIDKGDLWLKK